MPADQHAVARLAAMQSAALVGGPLTESPRVGNPRTAARWAHLWASSIDAAASEFGVSLGAVIREWRILYPGEPMARRGGR